MMEYMRIRTLVVLTLLQLCRAEISDTQGSWYSANIISDGLQPKTVPDVFSTEATFSTTNPIIVLSKSTTNPIENESTSTLRPPIPELSITSTSGNINQMSTTPSSLPTQANTLSTIKNYSERSLSTSSDIPTITVPPPTHTIQPVTLTPSVSYSQTTNTQSDSYEGVIPLSSTTPHYVFPSEHQYHQDHIDFLQNSDRSIYPSPQPSLESLFQTITQQPLKPDIVPELNNGPPTTIIHVQPDQQQITTPHSILSTEVTVVQPTASYQPSITTEPTLFPSSTPLLEPISPINNSINTESNNFPEITTQQIQTDIKSYQVYSSQPVPAVLKSTNQGQWQQIRFEVVPQPYSTNQPAQTEQSTPVRGSTQTPLSNYFLIYQQAPQSIQNFPSKPSVGPSGPQHLPFVLPPRTSTGPPSTKSPISSTVVTQVPPQTTRPPISTHQPVTSMPPPTIRPSVKPCSLTTIRPASTHNDVQGMQIFPMRIRVVAPSGSITNVQIKPRIMATTTKKPTTTRKPTTKRTRKPKPKKNTYDYCISSCKAPRNPICAAPLSSITIDPDALKGFPSICHMACHNSYRAEAYEKIAEGRCGKLRTRIRPVDSHTKLKKNELVKTEYSIDETGQKAVIQFSSGIA